MNKLVDWLMFSDVCETFQVINDKVYLPLDELCSFLVRFSIFTAVVILLGSFLGELTGSCFFDLFRFIRDKFRSKQLEG